MLIYSRPGLAGSFGAFSESLFVLEILYFGCQTEEVFLRSAEAGLSRSHYFSLGCSSRSGKGGAHGEMVYPQRCRGLQGRGSLDITGGFVKGYVRLLNPSLNYLRRMPFVGLKRHKQLLSYLRRQLLPSRCWQCQISANSFWLKWMHQVPDWAVLMQEVKPLAYSSQVLSGRGKLKSVSREIYRQFCWWCRNGATTW